MLHILGFLFIIIIAILVIGLSIIGSVFRSIFGLGGRRSSGTYQKGSGNYQSGGYSYNDRQQQSDSSATDSSAGTGRKPSKRKKLFTEDEGEYVDFEEIKE